MNENETEVVVDDDNYDVDLSEYETLTEDDGDGNQTEPTETEETSQEQESTQGEDEQAHEDTAADEQPGTEEPMFDLKYNKETKQYTRQQVTELAQKGLNYDHVTEQRDRLQQENADLAKFRDENSAILDTLRAAAEASGKSVPEYLTSIRTNLLVAQGISPETARERILREDAEQRLHSQQKAEEAEASSKRDAEQRQKDDIARFQKKYKDVDPKTIPQEVWEAVRGGELLTDAYGDYQRRELERQLREANEKLAIRAKNESNRQKSLGSLQSTKQETGKDPFLEGFLSDD
jgi:hypothetical protein|nr:MAG TPA: hypothetical protein [Caudoviricetes sp.]DAX82474.1 MAG TPA: hypothetical protein [Caudoviricetes sp.]